MNNVELAWYAGSIVNEHLYFYSETVHSLFKLDLNTMKVEWIDAIISKEFVTKSYGMKTALEYKGNLFLWTMYGVGYCKVSLDDFSTECRSLIDGIYTTGLIKENEDSIIIPSEKPWENLWRFDLKSERFTSVIADVTGIQDIVQESDVVQCADKVGDVIYFPVIQKDYVVTYNICNNKFDFISSPHSSFYGVTGDNNKIYLSQFGTYDIVEYEIGKGVFNIIRNQHGKGVNDDIPAYSKILKSNENILALPCTVDDRISVFDVKSQEWKVMDYPQGFLFNKKEKYLYSFYGIDIRNDGTIYVFQLSGNMLLEINNKITEINGFNITVPNKYADKINRTIVQYGPIQEGNEFGLADFLSML